MTHVLNLSQLTFHRNQNNSLKSIPKKLLNCITQKIYIYITQNSWLAICKVNFPAVFFVKKHLQTSVFSSGSPDVPRKTSQLQHVARPAGRHHRLLESRFLLNKRRLQRCNQQTQESLRSKMCLGLDRSNPRISSKLSRPFLPSLKRTASLHLQNGWLED